MKDVEKQERQQENQSSEENGGQDGFVEADAVDDKLVAVVVVVAW